MTATIQQLESRVAKVESDLKEIKAQIPLAEELKRPWLDRIYGAFEGNDVFLEAMKLGRQYRESQRPKGNKRKKAKKVP
jgi:hypothetical protein